MGIRSGMQKRLCILANDDEAPKFIGGNKGFLENFLYAVMNVVRFVMRKSHTSTKNSTYCSMMQEG